jgi:tryptophanyl-tRNA synthetase
MTGKVKTKTDAAVVLSGMRPTGRLHLGNYMGALHNWVRLQDDFKAVGVPNACYYFIADLHALTTEYADPSGVPESTLEVALDYLAAGLDPEQSTIFVQSDVLQHAELALLLGMFTPLSWLERVPTYKEQQEQLSQKDLNTYGFLGYPLLMAADILLYRPQYVPVGQDQMAHVELTREVARKFNSHYGRGHDVLPEPKVLVTASPKLPGTDGRKMSKSYGNTILMSEPEKEMRAKLKTMVTDPARMRRTDVGNPDICPVGDLHKVFSSDETRAKVWEGCKTAGIGCIECKGWAADGIAAVLGPIQERRSKFEQKPGLVREILSAGAAKARTTAATTMSTVHDAMYLRIK